MTDCADAAVRPIGDGARHDDRDVPHPDRHQQAPLRAGVRLAPRREGQLPRRSSGGGAPAGRGEDRGASEPCVHEPCDGLAGGEGIGQFLDIGTGIPTAPNLHQTAQEINPAARVVYCDNDPIVLRHAEALLISRPEGATDYVPADVREPKGIVEAARRTLDFDRPVAVSLLGLLHFLPDEDDPYAIVRTLVSTLAPGSYVVLSQGASDVNPERGEQGAAEYRKGGIRLALRTRDEFAHFLDGLDIVEPGLVTAPEWFRGTPAPRPEASGLYVAVARVP